MKKVVLLRHGESTWNRENRFTGWTDVDLSEKGVAEAARAGELLRKEGFLFGHAYTSYLKRAVKTLDVVLDKLDQDWIPVSKSWRLNEKHYGMLQGLNKRETAEKYGDGVPSVRWCAEQLHLSANYFGDLVKKETGKSAQEYIQLKVIDIAKERMFDTTKSISEIAYELGFRYPQHFTRLFKKCVGQSPNEYRTQN